MARLQLIERPPGEGTAPGAAYELGLVESSGAEELELSAGSEQLLRLCERIGYRVVHVQLVNISGASVDRDRHRPSDEVAELLRAGDVAAVRRWFAANPRVFLDSITFETSNGAGPARVRCDRRGGVDLIGPAEMRKAEIIPKLLTAFRRAFGLE